MHLFSHIFLIVLNNFFFMSSCMTDLAKLRKRNISQVFVYVYACKNLKHEGIMESFIQLPCDMHISFFLCDARSFEDFELACT